MNKIINFQKLIDFVKINTSSYDESHDFNHALSVFENCKKIIELEGLDVDWNMIAYTALLHDVCDHKYTSTITKEDLFRFIEENLGTEKAKHVLNIIDNISYSKEAKGKLITLQEPYQTYRDIISDADKIEALGEVGLRRCIQFSEAHNGNVIEHCHEKLLKLLPNGFIRTESGKKLAISGHEFILNYVNNR
jgi:uncharacterized protein